MKFNCIAFPASYLIICASFWAHNTAAIDLISQSQKDFQTESLNINQASNVDTHGNVRRRAIETNTVRLSLIDGTYANEKHPTENFSGQTTIEVDRADEYKISFLKFNTRCVNGDIQTMKLKLPVADGSPEGGKISKAHINWNSNTLNWNTTPDPIPSSGSVWIGQVDKDQMKEVTLPNSFITRYLDTVLSLRIDPGSDNGADYYKNRIVLEVTYNGALASGCTPSSTALNLLSLPSVPSVPSYPNNMRPTSYFQMKLYWEKSYDWQENKKEKRFCADCKNNCESDRIKLRVCDHTSKRQFWRWIDGKLESWEAPGYCMSYDKPDGNKKLSMKACDQANKFTNILTPPNNNKFKWHPLGSNRLCVTNPHHPRGNEELYFKRCETAYKDETAFWVTGTSWDKSLGGY